MLYNYHGVYGGAQVPKYTCLVVDFCERNNTFDDHHGMLRQFIYLFSQFISWLLYYYLNNIKTLMMIVIIGIMQEYYLFVKTSLFHIHISIPVACHINEVKSIYDQRHLSYS